MSERSGSRGNAPNRGRGNARPSSETAPVTGEVVEKQNTPSIKPNRPPDFVARYTSGPLPDPGILAEYDQVIPGLAERIVQQFEAEGADRRAQRRLDAKHDNVTRYLGLFLAFLMVVALAAAGVIIALKGYSLAGVAVIFGAIATVLTAFLRATARQRQEDESQSPKQARKRK